MLSVGINVKKVDFNRKTMLVYHVTDDVTGNPLPICGAKIDSLVSGSDVEYILTNLGREDFDYFKSDDSMMCSRCETVHLSPASDEDKSRKRLRRFELKQNQKKLKGSYEKQLAERYLNKCPKCGCQTESILTISPLFSDTFCKRCEVKWDFLGSVKHTGEFSIRVSDESGNQNGRIHGLIREPGPFWEWR